MFRELNSTAFCILFRISLNRAPKILLISTPSSLDPPTPHPPQKTVVGASLSSQNPSLGIVNYGKLISTANTLIIIITIIIYLFIYLFN